jgi:hypothetical protein
MDTAAAAHRTTPVPGAAAAGLRGWIAGHPLNAYFVITYGFAWLVALPLERFVGGCYAVAPFLAAVVVSAVVRPARSPHRHRRPEGTAMTTASGPAPRAAVPPGEHGIHRGPGSPGSRLAYLDNLKVTLVAG